MTIYMGDQLCSRWKNGIAGFRPKYGSQRAAKEASVRLTGRHPENAARGRSKNQGSIGRSLEERRLMHHACGMHLTGRGEGARRSGRGIVELG
jgi:hypothetical protein